MKQSKPWRILLVGDQAAVRHGLALVLAEERVGACHEASGRDDALAVASREPLDLALVDLTLRSDHALELVAELCALSIPVLVCPMHEAHGIVRRALAAGAGGHRAKRKAPLQLVRGARLP